MEDLKEIIELATNASTFAKNIFEVVKGKNQKQDKDSAKIGSSGDSAKIGSSGDSAKIGSSGDYAKIGSSGDSAKIGSSGDSAKIGSSGYYAQIGSSGDSAKIGSSGDYAKIGSSGDSAKIDSTGEKSIISAIGYKSHVKAKKGSWITLAEYKKDKNNRIVPHFVKTEQVDGVKIKEDTYYILYKGEFREIIKEDGIKCAIISKKGSVYKVYHLGDDKEIFLITNGDVWSHGSSIKEAKESLIYKISDRDCSEFKEWSLDTVITKEQAIKSYRVITGACEFGTRSFVESHKVPKKITPQVVIDMTQGHYGHEAYKDFFKKKR